MEKELYLFICDHKHTFRILCQEDGATVAIIGPYDETTAHRLIKKMHEFQTDKMQKMIAKIQELQKENQQLKDALPTERLSEHLKNCASSSVVECLLAK